MLPTPNDSLDPNPGSTTARSPSPQASACSSASTSPRFPITRLDATDRAEWQSKTIARSFANHSSRRADVAQSGYESPASSSPSAPSAPSTPTTPLSSSRTYHSLNYAPRQRTSVLRPSVASVFQSHSSQLGQQQQQTQQQQPAASSPRHTSPSQLLPNALPDATSPSHASPLTAASYLSSSPSYPAISLPDAVPPRGSSAARAPASSDAHTARATMARIQLQHMHDEARRLGLNDKSAGWLILEALQAATDGEWAAVAQILANGQATLLLPRDPPSVFTSSSQLSASFAYDHTIFTASPTPTSIPTPAALPPNHASDPLPILTLSGLRGNLARGPSDTTPSQTRIQQQSIPSQCFDLTLQTFVVTTSQSSMSSLKHATSRHETLEALAPLANLTLPHSAPCRYPSFSLSASNARFPLPPPLPARASSADDQPSGRDRPRTNSKLNAAGSKASASFASIFGGSARERRRQATPEIAGSEMVDAHSLSVNSVLLEPRSSHPHTASHQPSDAETGAQSPSSLGLHLRDEPSREPSEDVSSIQHSSRRSSVSTAAVDHSRRSISVWVVDHLVRRSAVMRSIRKTLDARIKTRLSAFHIHDSIAEVVASFAATYLPPVPSLNHAASSKSANVDRAQANSANRSRAASPIHIANPPYLAHPDDMSDNFQDFFNSIRDQLYNIDSSADSASLDSQRHQHDRIERQLEVVETVLCEEVYDRIFAPVTSRDRFHDDALASRIAALNVLGLSLRHLGLDVPSERTHEQADEAHHKNLLLDGLHRIVQQCGAQLQRLESALCHSPQAKLEVLVSAHKIAVDGVAQLPSIKMRDDDADEQAKAVLSEKAGESTSADLILPILIYSIVAANPSRLASHLLYIQRFRAESLVQGETSYCLVNVQAAVAFLENVDVKDLGLDSSRIGAHLGVNNAGPQPTPRMAGDAAKSDSLDPNGTAAAALAMPARIRGRLTQEIGDLAGASNKVITGVMGSSISAFSRMMGASANTPVANGSADASAVDASGRSREKSCASSDDPGLLTADAALRPARSRASSTTTPTDSSHLDEQVKEKDVASAPSGTDKPSIGDRLASLSMRGLLGSPAPSSSSSCSLGLGLPSTPANDSGTLASTSEPSSIASPRAVSRELPGPPPPSKPATTRPTTQGRTTSYLAAQLSRITAPRTTSSTSLAPSPVQDTSASTKPSKPLGASLQSPYPALWRPPTRDRPVHVVLASTGSVACVKIPLMVEELLKYANVRIQIIATDSSLHFYDKSVIAQLNTLYSPTSSTPYTVACLAAENLAAARPTPSASETRVPRAHLWQNCDEWNSFSRIGDPILHIELRRWADVVVVAPTSANTLARLCAGLCDDLLTCFLRALGRETPTLLFPAMNTMMYLHPLTEVHVRMAREVLGYEVIGPVEKRLACGDLGIGAMTEWMDVVHVVVDRFGLVKADKGGETDGGLHGGHV